MTKKKTLKIKKLEVVFDPQKRKEFLTGFSKRKNERRERARGEMEKCLKEERKRIRQRIKDGMKNLKKTFEPLRELTEGDKVDGDFYKKNSVYEDDDVEVKIVELTRAQLAKQSSLLGENRDDTLNDEKDKYDEENEAIDEINFIPGMDLDVDSVKKNKASNESEEENEDKNNAKPKIKIRGLDKIEVKGKKDLDRFTKKKMKNKLQQSNVFKLKQRFEQRANKKQAKRERYNTKKSLPKTQRKKMNMIVKRNRKGRNGDKN